MRICLFLALLLIAFGTVGLAPTAVQASPATVVCQSTHFKYNECPARFSAPILVMQKSQSPCIINNSWGYNPGTGYLWVSRGCAGVFADQAGYHYGQSGSMDVNARRYNNQGAFIGYGPTIVVQKNVVNNQVTIQRNSQTVINSNHDIARITNPDATQNIDSTPQFDRNGNPNFDTHGDYVGPHGLGALVDAPEDNNDGGQSAGESDNSSSGDDSGGDSDQTEAQ